MDTSLTKTRIEILLLFVLYLFILPRVYMDYDMGFWRQWALLIHHNGLANTYNTSINYFPVYVYGLYVYDLLQGTDANIIHNINSIKILFVFFDFLPIFVLCCFRQKLLSFKIPHLFLLLNIAYVFDSMVWGQIDSIYTSLSFLAIITALRYPIAGILLYVLALNTKQQAIEFLPIMAIALLYSLRKFKTAIIAIAGAIGLQVLLILPFMGTGGAGKLTAIAGNSVGLYNQLSICAFNIWYLITRSNPYFINSNDTYFLISYRATGFIMFSIAALAVQMHERYALPIIIFFFFYGVASKNYWLYILASIPFLLSLDKCFPDYLPIIHYKIIYASVVIALWYTATVIYGSYLYYRLIREPRTVR